jgi:hypothetical protein
MPNASDRIFVSIAVSRPDGGLDELPGAITAAERMAAWAQGQGYATLLLHDDAYSEITIDLLRDKITAAINEVTDRTELKRLVIFFAGHGAALAIGDQYWILTNWHRDSSEAIKVSSLQRMLEYYGPIQVSVIGDACQEFSARFIEIVGNGVLFRTNEEQRPYELDQFFAVDVGMQAFMIKAKDEQKDFCLFTEVLLDALEGDAQGAYFEAVGADKIVTSQSLARYLTNTVAQEAGKYGVRMIPRPRPGFYTDRTYLTIPGPPDKTVPRPITFSHEVDFPAADVDKWLQFEVRGAVEPYMRSVDKPWLIKPELPKAAQFDAQTKALKKAREASREAFVDKVSNAIVRDHFETGCGVCVSGAYVASVRASFGEVSSIDDQPNWFRIQLATTNSFGWSDTLVTLTDGRIVPVCVVNGFVAALHIIDTASLSLFHRPLAADEYKGREAIDLLAQAHAGLLSRKAIINVAAMLRYGKHRIITLGCIAAQFYDVIRDVDSLRSMAAFYAMNQQPVPLDIILYGGGAISESGGRLYADIPAVAARKPRTPEEGKKSFTYTETAAFKHYPIAGRIPWMRQAWGAVATARCDASAEAWRKQALAAMGHLAPGMFTIAKPSGRKPFLKLAGIKVIQGEPEPVLTQ